MAISIDAGSTRPHRDTPPASPSGRLVRDFMTRPAAVVPGDTTVAAAVQRLTGAHVAGAPVVQGAHVIGVVTLADLHRWTTEQDPDRLEEPARTLRSLGLRLDGLRVDRLLPRLAIAAGDGWSAGYALGVLDRAKLQRLPVVDDRGRLVGILSRDSLRAAGVRPERAVTTERAQ